MTKQTAYHIRTALIALQFLTTLGARAFAQDPAGAPEPPAPEPARIKEPAYSRVYQRDPNNRATIHIVPEEKGAEVRFAWASTSEGAAVEGISYSDGALIGVPMGGPYVIRGQVKAGKHDQVFEIYEVYVGDLWVLAGQSNMEGYGQLIDVTPSNDRVMLLGMDGNWGVAREPLHWLVDSPDPVHSGNPVGREERAKQAHRGRGSGAGLGLPFGTVLASATGVPIGLVACAHGGTSMAQWDPSKKGEGGNSLYGSMLRQVKLAGGHVKGMLWYQGEAEANPEGSKVYPKVFADFIAAVRADFGQPDLPFYLVQLGRFVKPTDPKPWNTVQEAQRLIPERVANTAVVSVVDLELDDGIHIGTQGLKRAGVRLARIALREQYGQIGGATPTLDRVYRTGDRTLVVKFKNVNLGPPPIPSSSKTLPGLPNAPAALLGTKPADASSGLVGLQPARHVAGFSIRKDDGVEIPMIYEAFVSPTKNSVILKLTENIPEGANLWYGWGLDPFCNLTDAFDMAVPVFGPVRLDRID